MNFPCCKHLADAAGLHFWLAQIYELMDRPSDASSEYGEVLKFKPDDVIALNNLAMLKLDSNAADALVLAVKAFELAPGNPEIAHTYGWTLMNNGRTSEALGVLESAARSAPEDGELNFHLALALIRDGDKRRGLEVLQTALADEDFESRAEAEQLLTQLRR